MVTVAREIEIDAESGPGIDEVVAAGIVRAGARLGRTRCARIRQTRIDVASRPRADSKMRLLVTFVLDD